MPSLNQKGLFAASDTFWSITIFIAGAVATVGDQMLFNLPMGPDMLGLFLGVVIATIFIPGAGVSSSEGWQKWLLTNATMALLGCVAGDVAIGVAGGKIGPFTAVVGVVVFVGVFIAYWSQGYQSRYHIMEVFEKDGWQGRYEHLTLLLGVLDSSRIRRPDIAHRFRQAVMNCEHETLLDPDEWRRLKSLVLEGTSGDQRARLEWVLEKARSELVADGHKLLGEDINEAAAGATVTHLNGHRNGQGS
ncbi:MAG: hypothetical protein KIH62_002895 [Candidatus Kerfeldbacteria bacterium]|nr:hypothetical protein [Candidatus Kerfeldbacteria bacterium]